MKYSQIIAYRYNVYLMHIECIYAYAYLHISKAYRYNEIVRDNKATRKIRLMYSEVVIQQKYYH